MTHSKEYVLGELFTMTKPRARSIKQYEPGDVPFVSPWIHNNGVTTYKQPKPGETLDPANTVTVTPLAGVAFYQPEPYLGRGGGGSAITILTHPRFTPNTGLYVATVITKTLEGTDYRNPVSMKTLKGKAITLPALENGDPDWEYMERSMSEICQRALEENTLDEELGEPETRLFKVADLFTLQRGKRLTKANQTSGNTRFIGTRKYDNGVSAWVGNTENIHPGNALTIARNGDVGFTFYQDKPFIAGDDAIILNSKTPISKEAHLYLTPLFEAIGANYNYMHKLSLTRLQEELSPLPVTASGDPDWEYMHKYMSGVLEAAQKDLEGAK